MIMQKVWYQWPPDMAAALVDKGVSFQRDWELVAEMPTVEPLSTTFNKHSLTLR